MKKAIHISQARAMMDRGKVINLIVVRKNGALFQANEVVSLRYDYYKGTRQVKFIRSGQIRTIHDVCIIGIDDFEVFI